ncbi:sensor protein PhoQ [Pantoea agglomerans]|uniref:Sensor protein PhoQ n=1 Tax=Enterobacter agglomerans TaxID=549 RepID=A0A379AHD2_ENTAG|nr:sensor protein PhoQ [Pantoea agglomerans]
MGNNLNAQQRLNDWDNDSNDTFTHSVAVNRYDATTNLPATHHCGGRLYPAGVAAF